MPGKYSYNAVLSDFSSQGLIPLPNDKQINYEREVSTPRHSNLSRSPWALNGSVTQASSATSGRRVVIQESDSDDDLRLPSTGARASTPITPKSPRASNTASTLQQQVRSKHGEQPKQARIEKPLLSTPIPSTPEPRQSGGVKAFIAERHQQEVGLGALPSSMAPELSLHEFLGSLPRSPERPRRQPRDAHLVPTKAPQSFCDGDVSVTEFLNLVPGPPPIFGADASTETRKSPVSSSARRSPLVSRLPKGVELPVRTRDQGNILERARAARPAKETPAQEYFERDYNLDFDGFTDRATSPFPRMDSITPGNTPLNRVASAKASMRRSALHHSATSVQPASLRHTGPPSQTANFATTPPLSPQDSTFYTDGQLSPGRESTTTHEQLMQSPRPPKAESKRRNSGSWSLPAIKKSGSGSNSFSNMFEDPGGRNILIFTSDEEDKEHEDDDDLDEDDLPTPRLQKLEEDVRFPSAEWGKISAGKHFTPGSKDPDSMSDTSADYPPDIGRNCRGSEYDSPLALALQSMRHGGELGAAYKPSQGRFKFRKSVYSSELLGRLGLRRSETMSDKGSTVGSSTSGESKMKARPTFHPASSSRGRLPVH